MNNADRESEMLSLPERNAPGELLRYLRGQLIDGVGKERHENERHEMSANGSFYSRINSDNESFPEIVHGSIRFVLKAPHPYDVHGRYWEVFGLFDNPLTADELGAEEFATLRQALSSGPGFVLRHFEDDQPGDYFLVDQNGATKLEEDFSVEGIMTPAIQPPFSGFRTAHEIFSGEGGVSSCNIVATAA